MIKKSLSYKQVIGLTICLVLLSIFIFGFSMNISNNNKIPSATIFNTKKVSASILAGGGYKEAEINGIDKFLILKELNNIKNYNIISSEKSDFYSNKAMGTISYQYTLYIKNYKGIEKPIVIQMLDTAKDITVNFKSSDFIKGGLDEVVTYCVKVNQNGYFTSKKLKKILNIKDVYKDLETIH